MGGLNLKIADAKAEVTLNRPDVRNAFNPELIQELTETFKKLATDTKVRYVILRGAGESFCAGADINWMKSMVGSTVEQNLADADKLFEMFQTISQCPKPVIGVVHGHAMGGGVGLTAVCDYVLAEEKTAFSFSEAKLGIVASVISSFSVQKIGLSHARALMTSARSFTAAEAMRIGLIHFCGSSTDVEKELKNVEQSFLTCAPTAIEQTKKLLNVISRTNDVNTIRKESTKVIAEQRVSAEGQEGLKSFLEKRKPQWSPKK